MVKDLQISIEIYLIHHVSAEPLPIMLTSGNKKKILYKKYSMNWLKFKSIHLTNEGMRYNIESMWRPSGNTTSFKR